MFWRRGDPEESFEHQSERAMPWRRAVEDDAVRRVHAASPIELGRRDAAALEGR